MSRNVVGVKLHSSGWWGSKSSSWAGETVGTRSRTPAPAASARARSTAAKATGWSGLNGSRSVWVTIASGAVSRIASTSRSSASPSTASG